MVENKQDWWNELEKKYDPEGVYRKKYQSEWNVKEVKQILFLKMSKNIIFWDI